MRLNKYEGNPILKPNPENAWESLGVLNPGVCLYEDKFYMLYRAAGYDEEHKINLGLAISEDGKNFVRQSEKPYFPSGFYEADAGGIEDPRIARMGSSYFMTYASRPYFPGQYWRVDERLAFNTSPNPAPLGAKRNNTVTYLAYTDNMKDFKKLGRITDSRLDNRDVILFPEKIGDKFVMFSRPLEWVGEKYGCDVPSIWMNFSDDMLEWNASESILFAKPEQEWETKKIGAACVPLLCDEGWLFLYHGVGKKDNIYCVGAMLLDAERPEKILARTAEPIMRPEFDYETKGFYNGCVFPTSMIEKGEDLYIYYGAADRYCCLATCKKQELIKHLINNCKR